MSARASRWRRAPQELSPRHGPDRAAGATLARIRPLLPVMGITRIANVTGLDRVGIPVVHGLPAELAAPSRSARARAWISPPPRLRASWRRSRPIHAETITLPVKLRQASASSGYWRTGMADVDRPALFAPAAAGGRSRDALDRGPGRSARQPALAAATSSSAPTTPCRCRPAAACFAANTNGLASGNRLAEADLPRHLRADRARRHDALALARRRRAHDAGRRPGHRRRPGLPRAARPLRARRASRCASGTPPRTSAVACFHA